MALLDDIGKLENERNNTRFAYLVRLCQENFGNPRIKGSHHIFKTPWIGDPRINLQPDGNKAKPYQVDQVVDALRRLYELEESKKASDLRQRQGE
jgi:hypothetical protein